MMYNNDTIYIYRWNWRDTLNLWELIFIFIWQQMYDDHRTLLEGMI